MYCANFLEQVGVCYSKNDSTAESIDKNRAFIRFKYFFSILSGKKFKDVFLNAYYLLAAISEPLILNHFKEVPNEKTVMPIKRWYSLLFVKFHSAHGFEMLVDEECQKRKNWK